MRAPIGIAAKFTVREDKTKSPHFIPYVPFPGRDVLDND